MAQLIPYIVFPGTCKEALEHYKEIFDGEIVSMQTFGESPIDVPQESQNRVFNADFKASDIHFKASDDLPSHGVKTGSNISLYVLFEKAENQEKVFRKLSIDGKVLFPIENNFGMLKDRYEVQWMLVYKGK